jgi:hypothetical protein
MANTVAVRYKDTKPGKGFDSAGNPRQGKVEVHGKITVTSAASGESLTPADVGLRVIDYINLTVDEGVGSAAGSQGRDAKYVFSQQEFYILESDSTTNTAGNNYAVSFVAVGDDAHDVELT